MKRQRRSVESELTYISVRAMNLTLEIMDKYNPSRKKIIDRMVETKSAAHGSEKLEGKESDKVKDEIRGIREATNTQVHTRRCSVWI